MNMTRVLSEFFSQLSAYFKGFRNISCTQIFNDWNIFEIVWLIASVSILAVISILTTDDYLVLTVIATVTGMLNLLLVAKGKILNYFFAFVNNLTYAYICYTQGIYGQFLLFAFFFFPMQFYGLYTWTKPQNITENSDIITKTLSNKYRIYLISGIVIAAFLYGFFILKGYFHQQIGLVADSLTGVVSVVAIILMVKAYIEQWVLWIVINTLSTVIWLQQYFSGSSDGIAFLAMWLIYLFNAIYGYINWLKLKKDI
ncbi:nicotinamide mononucleotide transporter [Francisella philomiragia]|nr:nicotinamide riboside transporter PnuC [Francisella philomiragia]MBK2093934.1 nicotinamide mononucleotide transporter [Francisella philomiragia]